MKDDAFLSEDISTGQCELYQIDTDKIYLKELMSLSKSAADNGSGYSRKPYVMVNYKMGKWLLDTFEATADTEINPNVNASNYDKAYDTCFVCIPINEGEKVNFGFIFISIPERKRTVLYPLKSSVEPYGI